MLLHKVCDVIALSNEGSALSNDTLTLHSSTRSTTNTQCNGLAAIHNDLTTFFNIM